MIGPMPIDGWPSPGSWESAPLKVSLFMSELFLTIAILFLLRPPWLKSSLILAAFPDLSDVYASFLSF